VLDDDFMEFMKELPIGFMQYLYEIYQLNQFAEQHGVPPDSVGMSIQGDNFRMVFTKQPIKAPDWFTKSNGIDETLDKDK